MRKTGTACGLVALLTSTLLAQTWRGSETVRLQVNDSKGRPIQGARVTLTFEGVPGELGPGIVATDAKGVAVLGDLAPGAWQVEVRHPDYLSYVAMIDVRRGKKPLVSASFLEAGGRSLAPVKVKFARGDRDRASPVLEARRAPEEPEPEPAVAAPAPSPAEVPPTAPPKPEPAVEAPPPSPAETPPAAPPKPEPAVEAPPPAPPEPEPPVEAPPPAPPEPEPAAPILAPPVAAVSALPAPPGPALAVDSYRQGSCEQCETGEWSVAVSSPVPATAPESRGTCPSELPDAAHETMQALSYSIGLELAGFLGPVADGSPDEALQHAEPDLANSFDGELAPFVRAASPCQILAVILPKEVRFTRVRFAASDQQNTGDCPPARDCPIGEARWLGGARVERGPSATVVYAFFENRATDRARRARLTAYFRPPNATWRPRLSAAE